MSLTAAAIRLMASKGMTAQDIADIAEAMEAPVPVLTPGALRTRKWRDRKESVTSDVTVTHHGDVSHVGEGAQVVVSSLPSLRSEEVKTPTEPNGSAPPKVAKAKKPRSRLCPADWQPSAADLAVGAGEGFTPGEIERELAKFRDHEFRDPHSEWSPTFRKWLRNAAERNPRKAHEQPHHNRPPTAREDRLGRMLAGAVAAVDERSA